MAWPEPAGRSLFLGGLKSIHMAVHCIRVFASTSGMSESEIQAAVSDWVDKNSEWMEDTDEHQISLETEVIGGSEYGLYRGTFRFELADAKDNLLQKAGDKLKNKVAWFRLVYHNCPHDEDPPESCPDWEERWNWEGKDATVPAAVDGLIPDTDVITDA